MNHFTNRRNAGFTLIELLIVIAIILILIAIALPNFLEAQLRAKITRATANMRTLETAALSHYTQWNFIYTDYNADGLLSYETRQKKSFILCVGSTGSFGPTDGGLEFIGGTDARRDYYGENMHCPLTTPIKYLEAIDMIDPFSDGTVPMGYDTRELPWPPPPATPKFPNDVTWYGAYFCAGPDRVAGDWQARLPFSPTNGTKSRGEMWDIIEVYPTSSRHDGYFRIKTF